MQKFFLQIFVFVLCCGTLVPASAQEKHSNWSTPTDFDSAPGDVFSGYGRDRFDSVKDSNSEFISESDVFASGNSATALSWFNPNPGLNALSFLGDRFSSRVSHSGNRKLRRHATRNKSLRSSQSAGGFSSDGIDASYITGYRAEDGGPCDAFASSTALAQPAASYAPPAPSLEGATDGTPLPRWSAARMPLRVYISKTVEEARHGYVQNEIYSALREWCLASNNKVSFRITYNYREADIIYISAANADNEWAQHSNDFHDGMFDTVTVSMILETLHTLDTKRLRAVCLHEAGHALGILDHANTRGAVMSLTATDETHPALTLTKTDKALLCDAYK